MIDALLALAVVLLLVSVTYGFTQAYYNFYRITENRGNNDEKEPGLAVD